MTPDLRPEALLALADELEEQHTFSAFWSAVDDAVAALRALAAQPQRCADLEQLLKVMERQYADALEGFAKMQQEGYLCRGHFNRSEPCPECVPLYRKGE
jgi:hypothetical protein